MIYSLSNYNQMIADKVRTAAYNRALRATVKPGSVVVELGSGTGYFAVLACKLGARKVYAIEPNKAIETAQKIAEANGCADRIEFIHDMSTHVTLPEQGDVILSDLRGALPFFGGHIPSIIDARERLLAPGGVLIPQKDELFAAFVSSSSVYAKFSDVAPDDPDAPDMSLMRAPLRNIVTRTDIKASDCVSGPLRIGSIDYATVASPTFRSAANWAPVEPTVTHGMCLWFDATLTEGVGYSSGPFGSDMVYGRLFFPFAEPIVAEKGDSISVTFHATLMGSHYVWRWNTLVTTPDGSIKADFRQSNFESFSGDSASVASPVAEVVAGN
ncbi:MAG TPA: 50S ribosomal protein L11 methyltransferase [Gemmatimonadaceae bacterium]|nr:50S ribosomal protein L11 methyltransferase [Gemmatimonadaceae bacterium]